MSEVGTQKDRLSMRMEEHVQAQRLILKVNPRYQGWCVMGRSKTGSN